MFLLISCSSVVAFQYFLCFVHGEGQQASKKREQKRLTNTLASFIASLVLSTRANKLAGGFPIHSKVQSHMPYYTTWRGEGEGGGVEFYRQRRS